MEFALRSNLSDETPRMALHYDDDASQGPRKTAIVYLALKGSRLVPR